MPHELVNNVEPVAIESFECKVTANVWATIDREANQLNLWLDLRVRTPDGNPIEAPSGHLAEDPANHTSVSLKLLDSEEKIRVFVRGVRDRFAAYGPLLLAMGGAEYLNAVAELQSNGLAPNHWDNVDEKTLIAEHLSQTEHILRLVYGVQDEVKSTRLSRMNKRELEIMIRNALAVIPKPARSRRKVFEVLKTAHGENAPETEDAFRKMLERKGIDWKTLKVDTP